MPEKKPQRSAVPLKKVGISLSTEAIRNIGEIQKGLGIRIRSETVEVSISRLLLLVSAIKAGNSFQIVSPEGEILQKVGSLQLARLYFMLNPRRT